MNKAHPIIKLADVQLPSIPSLWPLGWGWWLLIAVLVALLLRLFWNRIQKKRHSQAKQQALSELTLLQQKPTISQHDLQQAMTLTKRVAMSYYGRESCASLSGYSWYLWLDQHVSCEQSACFVSQQDFWQQVLYQSIPQDSSPASSETSSQSHSNVTQTQLQQGLSTLVIWVKQFDPKQASLPLGDST